MKKMYIVALSASAILMTGGIASASDINISTDPGTSWTVNNIATWNTTGNTMGGMSITVKFSDGTSAETVSWVNGVGASGNGWSLGMNNFNKNTWDADALWDLTNTGLHSISQLIISGKPGNTVFDIFFPDDANSTPGSARGQEIWEPGSFLTPASYVNPDLYVNAMYSNLVKVKDLSGSWLDLYETLTLSLSHADGAYFGKDEHFVFSLDTDNVIAPVPEPATMLMFGVGLVGLAGFRKRKKK